MIKLFARLILLTSPQPSLTDRAKYILDWLLHLAPVVFCLDLVNWWFSENQQFGTFMCIALLINLIVGCCFHLQQGSFQFKHFMYKNIEMAAVIIGVYVMLEMLRYTAGNNIAGEIFKVLIQVTTLLYPTSKVLKNIFIMTGGKYPPKFMMDKLYNFEKNGDLSEFFKSKQDENTD